MHAAQSAVQQVFNTVQSLDESFQKYFELNDGMLDSYRGQWEEQLFAQLAWRLKSRCVCAGTGNYFFRKLRDSITAFQALPEIQEQTSTNQILRKQ